MNEVVTSTGWQAQLDLEYGWRGGRTRLIHKQQHGPLTLQRSFYPEGDTCHNYILHPPGGVVAGDTLRINVKANSRAHCLLTTPGATKFYRSGSQLPGSQYQRLTVADGARLEWLPQPSIFFPGARVELKTDIEIAEGGKFVGWEMLCFGRPANKEPFDHGAIRSQTRLSLAGDLRLVEQFHTSADDMLLSATGMRGTAMQGCFIAAPCQEPHRKALEQILQSKTGDVYPHPVGVTLVDEVLIVRALGEQSEPMLELFTRLWSELRQQWLKKSPCLPRIWAT